LKNFLLAILVLIGRTNFSAHAAQPCGADEAVAAFQRSVNGALSQLPALDQNVDKCFNRIEHPEYIQQTHQILNAISSAYKNSLKTIDSAYDSLKRSKDAEFGSAVTQMTAGLAQTTKPMFDNAGNLKRHGFTVSDNKLNGQYKYPDCNSTKNDQPERRWASFYQNAQGVQSASKKLQAVVACLKN
jgi:hypothetical protein